MPRPFEVWVENLLLLAFFRENLFLLHILRISALRWTEFNQNRKDPIREIQRFPNLGHNLCENDKQTLHGLYVINYTKRFIPLFWASL